MADLFKKLNTLVKSSLNELIGDAANPRSSTIPPHRLGKDIDREVAALRQKINEAVEYEGSLQARVQQLHDEVARWDQQADDAVAAGNDDIARHAVEQMKRAEQRLTIAEADLRDHRLVAQELIVRVNTLEAAVADARRAQGETPGERAPDLHIPGGKLLSDVLRDAREKIAAMGDVLAAKEEIATPETPSDVAARATIDDDLERRRQRLSK